MPEDGSGCFLQAGTDPAFYQTKHCFPVLYIGVTPKTCRIPFGVCSNGNGSFVAQSSCGCLIPGNVPEGVRAAWLNEKGPCPWQGTATRRSLSFLLTQTIPWFYIQFLPHSAHAAAVTVPGLLLSNCCALALAPAVSNLPETWAAKCHQWCRRSSYISVMSRPCQECCYKHPLP